MIIAMLVIYVAIMIGIGLYTSKKTNSVSDFVLGGRNVGSWLTAFAYGTSYFSAVVFIGYAGQFGWKYGVSATWIGIGNAIIGSALAWIVLGKRTRTMTKHFNARTMPEFFEHRFKSKSLKIASALIVFFFLIPYTASVYNGLSRLFEMALNVPYSACIIAMAVLTAIYVILGGYTATAINDFIQGIIMLVGIILVVVIAVGKAGGLSTALNELGSITDVGVPENSLNSIFGPDPQSLLGVVLLTSLGTWGLPQMIHKFYAIKDEAAIKKGTIISTIFAIVVSCGSYFLGGFNRIFNTIEPEIASKTGRALINVNNGRPDFDAMIPTLLENTMPLIIIGVIVVLVLSASMSTLSALVLTSSSTLTLDLIKPSYKKEMSDKKEMLIMRILIAVFLIISVVIALNKNNYISTLMSISWGALAGSFLGPLTYGLFSKKITKASVWASFITGTGITIVHMFLFSLNFFPNLANKVNPLVLSPINAGAFAMIISLIIVPVISMFTPKMECKNVDEIFSCYDKIKTKA